jgi:acyl carrier protein
VRRWLFHKGSRGNVPSIGKVQNAVRGLDEEAQATISRLSAKFSNRLSRGQLSTLCVAASLAIVRPITRLERSVVLSDFLDSLNLVELVELLEELYKIEIPDEGAEKLITFKDVLRYVDSRVSSA